MSISKIAAPNDALRIYGTGGQVVVTQGIVARGSDFQRRAMDAVRTYSTFTPDNDPFGEHDFGTFEIDGVTCFWKIDYRNLAGNGFSPDPSNPTITKRVLTIGLMEEF